MIIKEDVNINIRNIIMSKQKEEVVSYMCILMITNMDLSGDLKVEVLTFSSRRGDMLKNVS